MIFPFGIFYVVEVMMNKKHLLKSNGLEIILYDYRVIITSHETLEYV